MRAQDRAFPGGLRGRDIGRQPLKVVCPVSVLTALRFDTGWAPGEGVHKAPPTGGNGSGEGTGWEGVPPRQVWAFTAENVPSPRPWASPTVVGRLPGYVAEPWPPQKPACARGRPESSPVPLSS